jgi:hypothetical protein
MIRVRLGLVLVCITVAMGASAANASAQSLTQSTCPGTFQVLHDDSIGKLRLTAGAYTITVLNPANLSCAQASRNFAEFLQDYDGVLRRPWIVDPRTARFTRGRGSPIGFFVARTGNPSGGGGNNPTSNQCGGTFRVVRSDHIGRLSLKAGPYRITLLNPRTLTCARASRLFTGFLYDFDGILQRPWIIANLNNATFTRGRGSSTGFRVKPASGRPSGPSGGGGRTQNECPGTFRVVRSTRIGPVRIQSGPYLTFPSRGSGLSCAQVTRQFMSFLNDNFSGLPSPWRLNGSTGTFTRGNKPGFRVKPAR